MHLVAKLSLAATLLLGAALVGRETFSSIVNGQRDPEHKSQILEGGYTLHVEDYTAGQCSFVTLSTQSERTRIVETCHGWSANSCSGMLAVLSNGVQVDRGRLVLPSQRSGGDVRQLDVDAIILSEIKRVRGAQFEYLHLHFEAPRCIPEGMELPFGGSTIEEEANGPSKDMQGRLTIMRDGRVAVQFSRV